MIDRLLPALSIVALGTAGLVASHFASAAPSDESRGSLPADESAARCSALEGKQLNGATIDGAEIIASGTALPPFNLKVKHEFCRVDAHVSPASGSTVKMQIWLPTEWNGKFAGVGGGGFNGGLGIASVILQRPTSNAFAAVVTDAGHDMSDTAEWALDNPEKVIDYGYRANHLGAVVGKAVVAAYYGTAAKRAYFHGCSNGGRDALMLAQRYPDDYDAIAVGAPANDFTGLMASFARTAQISRAPGIELSAAKMALVHEAAIKQCDVLDGVKDGLIERPQSCSFDPVVLQCKSGEGASCLSKVEVGAVNELYRGAYTSAGHQVMPGLPVGSEYEWANWLTGPKAGGPTMAQEFYRYMVYNDPEWNLGQFELDRDYAAAKREVGSLLDAVDPDLRPFIENGGKLLMYHGWDDAAIPAGNTLQYYAEVRRVVGSRADDAARLFMLPGVAHCAGGHGPDVIDYIEELDRWSGSGEAPERIVLTKYDTPFALVGLPANALRTKPVCAWPKSAHYKGTGAIDDEASFVCR